MHIVVVCGTNRDGALSRLLSTEVAESYRQIGLDVDLLDMNELPYPEGFDSRPCAFIGLAAGQFKGLRAVEHFQQVAGYQNAHIFPRRLFIGDSFKQFIDGKLADDELTTRLHEQAEGFVKFVQAVTV